MIWFRQILTNKCSLFKVTTTDELLLSSGNESEFENKGRLYLYKALGVSLRRYTLGTRTCAVRLFCFLNPHVHKNYVKMDLTKCVVDLIHAIIQSWEEGKELYIECGSKVRK